MKLRRFVSLTLMISIVGMLVSSVVLYIVPQGRVAYWAGWKLWGMDKTQWGNIHTNLGLVMILAGALHIWYNWGAIKVYLKNKARQIRVFTPEFTAAAGLCTVVVCFTLLQWPPLAWIQSAGEGIKNDAEIALGSPPYGHAEKSSLRNFLRNVGLDPAVARANLDSAGINVDDPEISIADLAAVNGLTPQELYAIMQRDSEGSPGVKTGLPPTMPMGSGRKTLAEFCADFGLEEAWAAATLKRAGWTLETGATLRDIAEANGREPLDLVDVLRHAGQ